MFDASVTAQRRDPGDAGAPGVDLLSTAEVTGWLDRLRHLDRELSDPERIDQLHVLERLKSAVTAAQARLTADFAKSQRESLEAAGVPTAKQGRAISAQVALARRMSPHHGSRHLGLAEALVHEMPQTLAALERGDTNEWRTTLIARETACLSREDRTRVDDELASRPGGLAALGDKQSGEEARKIAYRLDPGAAMRRNRKAETDRRVTIRPAPDTMTTVTGLLPVAQGVAAFAALSREADSLKARGDQRSRSQIMADVFVERLSGRAASTSYDPTRWDATPPSPPPSPEDGVPSGSTIELNLVMTDRTFLGEDDTPAHVDGYGALPALLARRLVADAPEGVKVWLRRLYTDPDSGALVAMDSRGRAFAHQLRRFLVIRDQLCRTPWCNAPIRHADHPKPVAHGGATSIENSQGLCEACNYVKETPGWTAHPGPSGAVTTSTPTGHSYTSAPPPPAGAPPAGAPPGGRDGPSTMERAFMAVLVA